MTRFGLLLDPRYQLHDAGFGHPERPARLDAIRAGLEWSGELATAARIEPRPIALDVLARVHAPHYIERVAKTCAAGRPFIDTPDSGICPHSYEIALLAAGGVAEAARQIGDGRLQRAFCAVRPPGHHAEYDFSMGFCLFANVVVAAHVLRHECGLQRVAIVDWDVHHGNGTQHLLESDPTVLFISLHGHPDHLYPGTGYEHEVGKGPGEGFTINLPMMPGATDDDYYAAFTRRVIPAIDRFQPEAILISAGFDAHAADPLANIDLTDDAFVWMLRRLLELADRHCEGRVLSALEGGYNLEVLRRCVSEHVHLLANE